MKSGDFSLGKAGREIRRGYEGVKVSPRESWCSPTSGPGRPGVSHIASDLKILHGSRRERELQVQHDGEKGLRAGWGSETRTEQTATAVDTAGSSHLGASSFLLS